MFDFLMPSKVDAWFGFWCLNSDTVALFLIVLGWKGSVGLHPSWLFLVQWDAFDQTNGRKILAVLNSSSILVLHVYILVSCGWEKKKLIAKAPVDFSYGNSVDCCVVTGNLEDYNLLRLWKFSKVLYFAATLWHVGWFWFGRFRICFSFWACLDLKIFEEKFL
jgi:hypothetical protein